MAVNPSSVESTTQQPRPRYEVKFMKSLQASEERPALKVPPDMKNMTTKHLKEIDSRKKRRSDLCFGRKSVGFLIPDFLSPTECKFIIDNAESLNLFTSVSSEFPQDYRRGDRILTISEDLAKELYTRLLLYFNKEDIEGQLPLGTQDSKSRWIPCALNECIKVIRNTRGSFFVPHMDGPWIPRDDHTSILTVLFYLNSCTEFQGGRTVFHCEGPGENKITVSSQQGMTLVFPHDVIHEGQEMTSGVRYFLRTEVMFRRLGMGYYDFDYIMNSKWRESTLLYFRADRGFKEDGCPKRFVQAYRRALDLQKESKDASLKKSAKIQLGNVVIPNVVWMLVLSKLQPTEIFASLFVNKSWNYFGRSPTLWYDIYQRTYKKDIIINEYQLKTYFAYDWLSEYINRQKSKGQKTRLVYMDRQKVVQGCIGGIYQAMGSSFSINETKEIHERLPFKTYTLGESGQMILTDKGEFWNPKAITAFTIPPVLLTTTKPKTLKDMEVKYDDFKKWLQTHNLETLIPHVSDTSPISSKDDIVFIEPPLQFPWKFTVYQSLRLQWAKASEARIAFIPFASFLIVGHGLQSGIVICNLFGGLIIPVWHQQVLENVICTWHDNKGMLKQLKCLREHINRIQQDLFDISDDVNPQDLKEIESRQSEIHRFLNSIVVFGSREEIGSYKGLKMFDEVENIPPKTITTKTISSHSYLSFVSKEDVSVFKRLGDFAIPILKNKLVFETDTNYNIVKESRIFYRTVGKTWQVYWNSQWSALDRPQQLLLQTAYYKQINEINLLPDQQQISSEGISMFGFLEDMNLQLETKERKLIYPLRHSQEIDDHLVCLFLKNKDSLVIPRPHQLPYCGIFFKGSDQYILLITNTKGYCFINNQIVECQIYSDSPHLLLRKSNKKKGDLSASSSLTLYQYFSEREGWINYEEKTQKSLAMTVEAAGLSAQLHFANYRVDLRQMSQENIKTGYRRQIRNLVCLLECSKIK